MAATLIVGLGGMGLKVTTRIADMARRAHLTDVEFVVMDTDVNDLRRVKERYPQIYTVQTSPRGTVGAALDQNHYARDLWFPVNDGLTGKPFTEGAGQVRAVSRLAFDHAVAQGYMSELEKAIEKLHDLSGESMRQEMRIMLVGSNNGGTGSGLVLPVAMYIRNFLITRYQDNAAIIRGFFLEPDTIFEKITDEEERNSLRCNAYATVREVDAFFRKEYAGDGDEFRHVVFNAPQPGSGERVDYPNILPYNYVFLMDAINSEGEHLPTHEAYLDHAAECVYAQALSAVSARSNSSEDNVIRKLAASGGRSRYCGAGSAYLEYPADVVQRYVGLRWAAANVSAEWLEIDKEYKRLLHDDDELDRGDYYRTSFDSKAGSTPFYKKLGRMVKQTIELEGGATEIVEPAVDFPDNVEMHAQQVNESRLTRQCTEMQRIVKNSEETFKSLPATDSEIEEQVESEGSEAANTVEQMQNMFFEAACRYYQAVNEEVERAAEHAARADYMVSELLDDPLDTNVADWQVESMFRRVGGVRIGCIHPSAVRYMLYVASAELAERIEDWDDVVKGATSRIQGFMRRKEREEENDDSSSNETGEKKKKFGLPSAPWANKSVLSDADKAEMVESGKRLKRFLKDIESKREAMVTKAYLQAAKRYVDALSGAFEAFYEYLNAQIPGIEKEIADIYSDSRYSSTKGQTHMYVNVAPACLDALMEECPMVGNSADLPADLCADIYHSLLKYTTLGKVHDNNDAKKAAFGGLFQATVVDYWVERAGEPGTASAEAIDLNIVQALVAEAKAVSGQVFFNQEEEAAYVRAYILDKMDQAFHVAAPFIEQPVGETPRNFKTCAYAPEILEDLGAYYTAVVNKLSEFNGTPVEKGGFSKQVIMFYRSVYGFCATNLPKYAPAHQGLESRPEGEYHHAYYRLVNELSPNLKENRMITPHIDKNWHLVAALPDMNEEYELQVKDAIVRAFVYGLVFQEFGSERMARDSATDISDIFYLQGTSRQPRTDLWVSNGTPCDKFYEVYDAMKFNPRAVAMLAARSDARMAREKNNTVGLSIEHCELLQNVRSRAFSFNAEDDYAAIVEAIAAYRAEGAAGYARSEGGFSLPSKLVTNMFNISKEDDLPRRSILEIPLFYRISLPHSEMRAGEIETMIQSIFTVVRTHLGNFCSGLDLDDQAGRFFEEQYLLFERNLVDTERAFPGIQADRTVNAVREKTLSFVEPIEGRYVRLKGMMGSIVNAWR